MRPQFMQRVPTALEVSVATVLVQSSNACHNVAWIISPGALGYATLRGLRPREVVATAGPACQPGIASGLPAAQSLQGVHGRPFDPPGRAPQCYDQFIWSWRFGYKSRNCQKVCFSQRRTNFPAWSHKAELSPRRSISRATSLESYWKRVANAKAFRIYRLLPNGATIPSSSTRKWAASGDSDTGRSFGS